MSKLNKIYVPQENPNDDQVTIVEWDVENGSFIKKDSQIAKLETTKAVFDIFSEYEGYIYYKDNAGDNIFVGDILAYVSDRIIDNNKLKFVKEPVANRMKTVDPIIPITAKAKKLMKMHGLEISDFEKVEKITSDIVDQRLKKDKTDNNGKTNDDHSDSTLEEYFPPSKLSEIDLLSEQYKGLISSYVSVPFDKKIVDNLKKKIFEKESINVTIIQLIIYNVSRLLREYSLFNGYYSNRKLYIYNDINIGFAINVGGNGLKVPIVKNTDNKSMVTIVEEMNELSLKYMRNELSIDELTEGTFTITDLSSTSVTHFLPLLNYKQAAILAICAPHPESNFFNVILNFDHRIVDGMIASQFLEDLRNAVLN